MAWTSSEYRPAYLGRGRGRGVERSGVKSRQDKGHSRPGTNASAWTSQPKEEDDEEEDDHRSHVRGSKEAADEETEDRDQLDDIVSRLLQSYNVQAESEEGSLWDQLTRTDNAYRRLLLTAIPALTLTLTLNVTCDKRPGQTYVPSSQLSQLICVCVCFVSPILLTKV